MSRTGDAIVKALEGAFHAMTPAERAFTRNIRPASMGDEVDDSGSPGAPLPIDPTTLPGHDWATEAEYRRFVEETTIPGDLYHEREG